MGDKKRNWKLTRSKIMFGSAIILFSFVITASIYYQDVIGTDSQSFDWNQEYDRFVQIDKIISDHTTEKSEVVMINNPVGFHYQTDQWAIVLPNAEQAQFEELIRKFNVKYLVMDYKVPIRMYDYFGSIQGIRAIGSLSDYETIIYEIEN